MSLDRGRLARSALSLAVIAILGASSTFFLAAADAILVPADLVIVALLTAAALVIAVGATSREPHVAVRNYVALVVGMLAGTAVPVPNLHECDESGASPWESAVPLVLFATGVAMLFFCGWLLGSTMRELGTSRRRRAAPATASKQGDGPR